MLTIAQVALKLHVSESRVRKWIGSGELPHYRLGNRIRIGENELDRFLERSKSSLKDPVHDPNFAGYYEEIMADIERKSLGRAAASPRGHHGHDRKPAQ